MTSSFIIDEGKYLIFSKTRGDESAAFRVNNTATYFSKGQHFTYLIFISSFMKYYFQDLKIRIRSFKTFHSFSDQLPKLSQDDHARFSLLNQLYPSAFYIAMPDAEPSFPSYIQARQTAHAGLGLFTSERIEAGEFIFSIERPLITALDSGRLTDTCEWCLRVVRDGEEGEQRLRSCTGCKVVRYCRKVGPRLYIIMHGDISLAIYQGPYSRIKSLLSVDTRNFGFDVLSHVNWSL